MIYLHHYPASLFSEKVRLLLGHYGLAWHSVEIPSIMPRPLLMPLSGGYRRTPVLQIGANVYCDTKIICQALARHVGDDSLYAAGFAAHRVADWADTELFRIVVAMNFRPEALGVMMSQFSEEEAAAFARDRAELTGDQPIASFTPAAAKAVLDHTLGELERSLSGGDFLFGPAPSIADFAVYHNLWFLNNNPVNAPLLNGYASVRRWMATMAAIGHGDVSESTGEAALAAAGHAEPVRFELAAPADAVWQAGDVVDVTPVDYGCVPVQGTLVAQGPDEVILAREVVEVGMVHTHFPQAGFEIAGAG